MTTESTPTQPTPVTRTRGATADTATGATAQPASGRRRTRRHPAGASRILATGLAAASTFGLVAVLGSRAPVPQVQAAEAEPVAAPATTAVPTTAPAPVVVVRRTYVAVDGNATGTASTPSATPRAAAPTRSAAPVTAAPRRSAPAATSSSS